MSAPAPETPVHEEYPAVSAWSCFHCRRRKVRCDRRQPCSHCLRGGLDCTFPSSGRPPTRRCHSGAPDTASKTDQSELLRRIRRLEELVTNLTSQLERNDLRSATGAIESHALLKDGRNTRLMRHVDAEMQRQMHRSRADDDQDAPVRDITKELGKLFTHQTDSLYVGNRLVGHIYDELKSMRREVEGDFDYEATEVSEQFFNAPSPIGSFIWEPTLSSGSIQSLQPLPSQVPFLWQTYVENVDPWIKVLHEPSISHTIKVSKGRFHSMTPGTRAVMFAACLAAITSLSEDDVMDNFNEEKTKLLAKWTLGAEQALSQAGLTTTTDLNVVQAFIIYLEVIGQKSLMRPIWVLGGLLYRIALSMGLHRDASHFPNVSPFNAEMRRRVWWHICFSDSRAGDCQLSHAGLPDSVFDTQHPSHVNDSDLCPDMAEAPKSRDDFADSTICSIRCNLWRFSRRIKQEMFVQLARGENVDAYVGKRMRIIDEMREFAVKELQQRMKPEDPLHKFSHVIISLELAKFELAINFGSTIFAEGRGDHNRKLFFLATAILDHTFRLETQHSAERWRWVLLGEVPWHCMTTTLTYLIKFPWGPICERVWRLTKREFDRIPVPQQSDPMRQPLHQLLLNVDKYRQKEIERLRAQAEVLTRLTYVAKLGPCMPELGDLTAGRLGFEISAAEERLQLETNISSQKVTNIPGQDGLGASDGLTAQMDSNAWVMPSVPDPETNHDMLSQLFTNSFVGSYDVLTDASEPCGDAQCDTTATADNIELDMWGNQEMRDAFGGASDNWLF